jgi:hypothetical protein
LTTFAKKIVCNTCTYTFNEKGISMVSNNDTHTG